jgi:hypothetical protein
MQSCQKTRFLYSFFFLKKNNVAVELSTTLRLSGSFEMGDLINIEKAEHTQIEATHVKIQFISIPTFSLNQLFNTFLKELLGSLSKQVLIYNSTDSLFLD